MLQKVKETRNASTLLFFRDLMDQDAQVSPNIIEDSYLNDSGGISALGDVFISSKIQVTEGDVLKLVEYSHLTVYGCCFDASDNFVCSLTSILSIDGFTIPSGVAYVRVNVDKRTNVPTMRVLKVGAIDRTAIVDKISIIGDSIVHGYNGAKTISEYMDEMIGSTSQNLGNGGDKVSDVYARLSQIRSDSDIILMFAGVNDYLRVTTIGTISDSTTATFYGALNLSMAYLKNNFMSSRKYYIIPMRTSVAPDSVVDVLLSYVTAIKAVCVKYGIPVIDLYNDAIFDLSNDGHNGVFGQDGLHPNAFGNAVIAQELVRRIT